ncbi:MAG TPA: TetR/AcrR family transcriptional regulator [Polyangiaceae bacterium]
MSKPDRTASLRVQAKERTREALVDAAIACFSEGGIEAPSLDAICERAGCTRGAFYVHFRDRDELVVAAMERRRGHVLATFLGATDTPIRDVLRAVAGAIEAKLLPVPGAVRSGELITAARRSRSIRETHARLTSDLVDTLAERVRADQSHGRVRKDIGPKALALVLLLVEAGAELWLDLGVPLDARSVTSALETLLELGTARRVRAPKRSIRSGAGKRA